MLRPTTRPLSPLFRLRTLLRHFSTPPPPHPSLSPPQFLSPFSSAAGPFHQSPEQAQLAQSLSSELLTNPTTTETDPISLPQRLHLSFSHITLTPTLLLTTLNNSPNAGRSVIGLLQWALSKPDFNPTDETISHFVDYLGRKKDFKAAHDVLIQARGISGPKSFESLVDRLVRAGRPKQAVSLFDTMEKDYMFLRNMVSLKCIVERLCEHGFASYAEKMVKSLANEFFPDECICDLLIKGWCVGGKLEEAKRLAGEMYRGGFEIGNLGYNDILDCVCRICRKKDPFRLESEANKVLVEMEKIGVPRDVETFNVLIGNLCKIRKTEEAVDWFGRMGEWGCCPNETTFLLVIRSLYQSARVGEGDEMIDRMKSMGFGDALDKKAYYGFLKILCGIERIDHAMTVFAKMKGDGCKPGFKTYDLLMGKLCAHGRLDKANVLFKEAQSKGVPVEPKVYKLDPRFVKKPMVVKKEKKRETLPEKMARKRRSLKKLRLSYVKKPKRMMRRAF